jgi:uncharacterized protein
MIRVVLDTNIIVSALMTPSGQEALILLLALRRELELCVSVTVLAEYETVLRRPRLKLKASDVDTALAAIREVGHLVHPTTTLTQSSHESDNRFYECAAAVQADYIVTGNSKHFSKGYKTTKIVNARQLLEILRSQTDQ